MSEYVEAGNLKVNKALYELVRDEIAPGTGVDPDGIGDKAKGVERVWGQDFFS